MELQGRLPELEAQGLRVAAISYDPPETLAAFARQRSITFPLLSDVGSATIKRYGILNTVVDEAFGPNRDDPGVKANVATFVAVVPPSAMMKGIPFPGTFLLDRQGRVTSRFFEHSYVERNTVASTMLTLGTASAPVTATKISTPHLDITTYASDPAIAVGNRFALAADIVPKPGMHVYAPGAAGYRVVALTIAEQPFVRLLPMQHPASEIYVFAPLNERVPVYQKPFRLVQEVVLEGTREAQALLRGKNSITLTGALEYQACDDKICYNPASVPLSWDLTLRALVTERPSRPQ